MATRRHVIVLGSCLALLAACSNSPLQQAQREPVTIASLSLVSGDQRPEWSLLISNSSPKQIWLDMKSPAATQFAWRLLRQGRVIRSGRSLQPTVPFETAGHYSLGPVDIMPGRVFRWSLDEDCPDLLNPALLGKADQVAWLYYVWDNYSQRWMSWSGVLAIGQVDEGISAKQHTQD